MHAGIAGAGLVGRLLAWRLSRAGWRVSIFEQSSADTDHSAAFAAAGMLSLYAELESAELTIIELGKKSLPLWQDWLTQLNGLDAFQQMGSLVIAHPKDRSELIRFQQLLQAKISKAQLIPLTSAWLSQQEPALSDVQGFYLAEEGYINTRYLLTLLNDYFSKNDIITKFDTVIDAVLPHQLKTTSAVYDFDWVFDCRGYGAQSNFKTLRSVRGEIITIHAPEIEIKRPIRLLHPRYPIYVVPRPNQHYLVGASEIEADDESPISVRTCLELLSSLYSLHPLFAEARVIEMTTAKRAALPDNLPKIRYQKGMIAINGLYRHGYLIAPSLIETACQLVSMDVTHNSTTHPCLEMMSYD